MVIVVTGTIAPGEQWHLTVKKVEERLLQYRQALEQLILSGVKLPIIFCENSGYGTEELNDLVELAKDNQCELELLSFQGDAEAVRVHGKGYGEGEIMAFLWEHSKLTQGKKYFLKITGRLMLDNVSPIVKKLQKNQIYLNIPNVHRRDIYDTRVYAMPIAVYQKYFACGYQTVNDEGGYYLEHVFTDVVLENKLNVKNFPCYPRIVGVSGSDGVVYSYSKWKTTIRDLLSIFNIYGRIKC